MENIMLEDNYKLIIAVVNDGYAGEVIAAAKKAGNKGAVVMSGKSFEENERMFLGFRVHRSREVVLTLVKDELVVPVMKEIYKCVDVIGPANGCVMALPVENVAGFLSKEEAQSVIEAMHKDEVSSNTNNVSE